MDLVPHIPHLHGLDLQFLKMHIDQEARTNGHGPMEGLTNGYRPSTYV